MSYSIVVTNKFKKDAKRLTKKYLSLKAELLKLNTLLSTSPQAGTNIGKNIFKIRIAIASKNTGKSGGARIITYVVTENKEVYLLTIYDKADFDTIDDATLKKIIKNI